MKVSNKIDNVSMNDVEKAILTITDGENIVEKEFKDTKENVEDFFYYNANTVLTAQFIMKPPKEVKKDEVK